LLRVNGSHHIYGKPASVERGIRCGAISSGFRCAHQGYLLEWNKPPQDKNKKGD
jgi:hypothetical protein